MELQRKHREISEKVQSVLVDTVDFAFGAQLPESMRLTDAIRSIGSSEYHSKSQAKSLKAEKEREQRRKEKKRRARLEAQKRMEKIAAAQQSMLIDQLSYSQGGKYCTLQSMV